MGACSQVLSLSQGREVLTGRCLTGPKLAAEAGLLEQAAPWAGVLLEQAVRVREQCQPFRLCLTISLGTWVP